MSGLQMGFQSRYHLVWCSGAAGLEIQPATLQTVWFVQTGQSDAAVWYVQPKRWLQLLRLDRFVSVGVADR